jgi:aryl-alcohol dehydrogenase-like predicted oxidoreductase
MKYNHLGYTGIFTTDIALGTMTFGDPREKGTSPEESERIIHAYLDAGGNHIDTANVYNDGVSEEIVGKAIQGRRDSLILATKVNFANTEDPNRKGLSRNNIIKSAEESLKRLQTDYIDLYYMHCWDPQTPIEESLRAFDDLVTSGKVRYIGVSNFKVWQLMKALGYSDAMGWSRFVAAQYQYSLVVRDIEYEFVELCEEEGMGIMPWGPLGGGFLTGKYKRDKKPESGRIATHPDHTEEAWKRRNTDRNWAIMDAVREIAESHDVSPAEVAIAWTRQKTAVSSVIIGARTMPQLESNLKAAELNLSDEEMKTLDEVSALPERYPYRFQENYARKEP